MSGKKKFTNKQVPKAKRDPIIQGLVTSYMNRGSNIIVITFEDGDTPGMIHPVFCSSLGPDHTRKAIIELAAAYVAYEVIA